MHRHRIESGATLMEFDGVGETAVNSGTRHHAASSFVISTYYVKLSNLHADLGMQVPTVGR